MRLKLIGYHATDVQACLDIKTSEKFNMSDNNREIDFNTSEIKYHWLGKGAYFWSNNFEMAQFWANSKKPDEAIIKVSISCEEEEFLDFTVASKLRFLEEMVEQIIDENNIELAESLLEKKDKIYPLIGWIIDYFMISKNSVYKVVYYPFTVHSKYHKILYKITPQICVKDQSVIDFKSMEIYKSDGTPLQLNCIEYGKKKVLKSIKATNNKRRTHKILSIDKVKRSDM